jgi:hypothetical protein
MAALAAVGIGLGLLAPAPAGAVAPPKAKAIVVTAAPATGVFSQSVRLTVAITPKGGGTPKGGTVTFLDGDAPIGTATATTRNTTFTTSALAPGEHRITASYGGDPVTAPGDSTPVTVTVAKAATAVTLTTTGTVEPGQPATLKATVRALAPAAASRRPTGTVVFTRGSAQARVAVNANGVATWRPTLAEGSHEIVATYEGNDTYEPSTSSAVLQQVAGARAPSVVDQETTAPITEGKAVMDRFGVKVDLGEVFTAGMTGELDTVTIQVRRPELDLPLALPLQVRITTVSGGLPTGTVIGSGELDATTLPNVATHVVDVPLDVAAAVTAGTQYALE